MFLQMSQFVSGDDDSGESAGVLDDGHTVHLLQTLVDDAGAADVGESGRAAVALAVTALPATHVKPVILVETFLEVVF